MMWKEAAVVCFKMLCRHLPGAAEETHKITDRISGVTEI
jgi:hypothetical protein